MWISMIKHLKKWFTLGELMIVIGIIGILAAALFPSLNSYLARSRDVTLMTQGKYFMQSMELYKNDRGYYPLMSDYWYPGTEMPLHVLSGTIIPQYGSRYPIDVQKTVIHKYAGGITPIRYTVLLFTETMYGSWITSRWHTCIFGMRNWIPLEYWNGDFSDTGILQPICSFQ